MRQPTAEAVPTGKNEPTRQAKALAVPTHFDSKLMQLLDD
jgi:hypothetical protein